MKHTEFTTVDTELNKWRVLSDMLAGEDCDEQTLLDTLEGATDLHEALLVVADSIAEDEMQLAGRKNYTDKLGARKTRIERTIDTKRGLILMAMDRAALPAVKGAMATLSVRQVKPGVSITDESLIPAKYFKAVDPALDKKALTEAVKGGAKVPGAELGNGGISLTIRHK